MAGETPTETPPAADPEAPVAGAPAAQAEAEAPVTPLADEQLHGVAGGTNWGNRNPNSPF